MGAGCEALGDLAEAEGQGGVCSQGEAILGPAWNKSKVQGYGQPCEFGAQPQSRQSAWGCLSPGSPLGSTGVAKLRSLHLIWDSVEPVKYLTGQVEI